MRKFFRMVTVTIIAAISCETYAQHSPVGIVSAQDSVKNIQFGMISSIATEGGHGVQFGGVQILRHNVSTVCSWVVSAISQTAWSAVCN